MRMLCADGSISIMDLTYREAQKLCKEHGLRAVGKHNDLIDRLLKYEEEHNVELKVYPNVVIQVVKQ